MEESIIYTLNSLVYDREDKLITEEGKIPGIPIGTKIKIHYKETTPEILHNFGWRYDKKEDDFTVYNSERGVFYLERGKYPCYKFSVLFKSKDPFYSTYFLIKYCPELRDGLKIETITPSRANDFEELSILYLSPDPYWNNLQLARRRLAFSKLLNGRLSLRSLELPLDIMESIIKQIDSCDHAVNLDDVLEDDEEDDEDFDGFCGCGKKRKKKKRKSKKKRKKTRKKKSKRKKHKTKRRN